MAGFDLIVKVMVSVRICVVFFPLLPAGAMCHAYDMAVARC